MGFVCHAKANMQLVGRDISVATRQTVTNKFFPKVSSALTWRNVINKDTLPTFLPQLEKIAKDMNVASGDQLISLGNELSTQVSFMSQYTGTIVTAPDLEKVKESLDDDLLFKATVRTWASEILSEAQKLKDAFQEAVGQLTMVSLALFEVQKHVQGAFVVFNSICEIVNNSGNFLAHVTAFSKRYASLLDKLDTTTSLQDSWMTKTTYAFPIELASEIPWLSRALTMIPDFALHPWFSKMCYSSVWTSQVLAPFMEEMVKDLNHETRYINSLFALQEKARNPVVASVLKEMETHVPTYTEEDFADTVDILTELYLGRFPKDLARLDRICRNRTGYTLPNLIATLDDSLTLVEKQLLTEQGIAGIAQFIGGKDDDTDDQDRPLPPKKKVSDVVSSVEKAKRKLEIRRAALDAMLEAKGVTRDAVLESSILTFKEQLERNPAEALLSLQTANHHSNYGFDEMQMITSMKEYLEAEIELENLQTEQERAEHQAERMLKAHRWTIILWLIAGGVGVGMAMLLVGLPEIGKQAIESEGLGWAAWGWTTRKLQNFGLMNFDILRAFSPVEWWKSLSGGEYLNLVNMFVTAKAALYGAAAVLSLWSTAMTSFGLVIADGLLDGRAADSWKIQKEILKQQANATLPSLLNQLKDLLLTLESNGQMMRNLVISAAGNAATMWYSGNHIGAMMALPAGTSRAKIFENLPALVQKVDTTGKNPVQIQTEVRNRLRAVENNDVNSRLRQSEETARAVQGMSKSEEKEEAKGSSPAPKRLTYKERKRQDMPFLQIKDKK